MAAEVEGAPASSDRASTPFGESAPAPSQPTFKKRVATGKKFRRRERGGTTRDASEGTAGVGTDRATGEGEETARDDAAATQEKEKAAQDAIDKVVDPGSKEGKEGVDSSSNSTGNSAVTSTGNNTSQGHVSEEEEDGSRLDLLNDLREEQRARRRAGGRSVSALMEGPRRKEKNPLVVKGQGVDGVDPEPGASFGLNEAPAGKAKTSNISTMIESQFKSGGTGGWGADPDGKDSVKHEQLMEQYVKERMGDNAGKGGGSSDKEAEDDNTGGGGGRGGMLSEEDRLYTIPEDFKRKVEEAKQEFDTGARHGDEMDGEVGSGAQIAWNTGLAEIALPIEFKLKNMEDTLSARSKMEEARSRRRNAPGENSSVTGSLTANYSHHQREWAMQIRDLQNRQAMAEESQTKQAPTKSGPGIASSNALAASGGGDGATGSSNRESGSGSGGGRGVTGPGGLKLKHSSDNAVLERFKKRTRRF